ncbi:MAG TPA: winged helix-turn-helix domain-containing protein [Candidatus Sulfotelmatobacter sp.]|nr:winged helix-turn-helix domain-containing protein [Candidatus Sulfotelmatobacter sp.]
MLQRLFSSKTRVDLLRLFFTHPDHRYYVRQVSRELKRDISGIKRELDNLEKAGILTSEKIGNLRYYSANKTAAIYPEIKSIVAKTVGARGAISKALGQLSGLQQAWLYTTNSHPPAEGSGPILVLVVGRVDLTELNEAVTRLERSLGREINYTVFDEGEFQRRRAEADTFVTEILTGNSILVVGRDDGP